MALSARMTPTKEARRIDAMRAILGAGAVAAHGIAVGIGDDAAVLEPPVDGGRIVISVDEQVEGTHFRRELLSPEDIGYRATMSAASDLAAMGARPWCAVVALSLPDWVTDDVLEGIARGQREASDALGLSIVGGNLARAPVLSIATTVLGVSSVPAPGGPLLRSGAIAGDGIYVAGPLGLASLGLRALIEQRTEPALQQACDAWRRPSARVVEGAAVAGFAHAAIDVSDGLAKDLGAICAASRVAAEVDENDLRALARACGADVAATALGADLLAAMLEGGEDYALVIAQPPATGRHADARLHAHAHAHGFTRIGTFVDESQGQGVWLIGNDGARRPVSGGFDHFTKTE